MQALILVGGEGTRLRPLTSTMPKPVVPLVGQPFISYMLEWLRRHGIDDVILSCGFMADSMRTVLGDGAELGVRLRYIEEPKPLGTGGALKFAEALLDERFFMLNGDVLTDIDLTAQLRQHEQTGARATLALIPVEDPSAYGLVRRRPDCSVTEFVEKPGPEQIDTNLINAGAYILERDVLAGMAPAGSTISIEREVFPTLVDDGLYGYEAGAYWLDIGTPERYLQATFDILEGNVQTAVGQRLAGAGSTLQNDASVEGRVVAPALLGAGCAIGRAVDRRRARRARRRGDRGRGRARRELGAARRGRRRGGHDGQRRDHRAPGVDRRRLPHLRRRRARRRRQRGVGKHPCRRRAYLPRGATARWSDPVLTAVSELSREAIDAVDVSKQLDDILGMPDQLRDALWRVESANLKPADSPAGLVVAGMGGSAIGGGLARAVLGDRASRPIVLARGYALPAWTTPDTTVLCASYSGNTEETLAVFEAAGAVGANRVVATTGGRLAEDARADDVPVIPLPGGFQPRAPSPTRSSSRSRSPPCAAPARACTPRSTSPPPTPSASSTRWGPDGPPDGLAKALARGLHRTIPQISGAGLTAPIAYRWKTQINENAKTPAFASELPELDHNEIVGWEGASELGPFSSVFLDDSDLHPRIRQRIELTRGLIGGGGASTYRIESVGETRTERLVSLLLLGDLVSLYLAVLRGVDPTPVKTLDQLKEALAQG